jgi:hypothetical protein
MRFARSRLVFLCLAALDEVVVACGFGPAVPSLQLRAILATLYALGDGEDRGAFDAFWQVAQLAPTVTLTAHQANHRRVTDLGRLWPQICRHVGVEPSTELVMRLAAARRGREDDRARLVRLLDENEQRRRTFEQHRRQKQQCTITD